MSEPEITEAVHTSDNLVYADVRMGTDKEQNEIGISPAEARMLEVDDLVAELSTLSRELPDDLEWVTHNKLPRRLYPRMRTLLSRQGLEELPDGSRQEARLKILGAIGLCLQKASCIAFIDTKLVGDSELSFSELEALYRRHPESSTALKELHIAIPANASEDWEPESWRLLTDILLGTQSLEEVVLKDLPLSELSQLSKAVAASARDSGSFRKVRIQHGYRNLYRFSGTTESLIEGWAGKVVTAPNLKELSIELGRFADENVAAALVNGNTSHTSRPSTETLKLSIGLPSRDSPYREQEYGDTVAEEVEEEEGEEEDDACKSDGPGTSVATVSANQKRMGFLGRLLSRAFLGSPGNSSFNSLHVRHTARRSSAETKADLEVLCQVLGTDSHITELGLFGFSRIKGRNLRGFFKSLQLNGGHIQSLSLEGAHFDSDSLAMFVKMLKASSMRALRHLTLDCEGSEDSLDWSGFYTSLSQMESVSLSGDVGQPRAERELCGWIQGSKALRKLNLNEVPGRRNVNWRSVFPCLRENTNLKFLGVGAQSLDDDESYRELMEILQVNSNLQEVEFYYGDGNGARQAAVREALRSKGRQESYLAELRKGLGDGKAQWQRPKCGRLFMCGSPEAGKTRLTRTMLKLASKKSRMKRFKEIFLRRTEGVEIHTLRNCDDPEMQIRVWDLAGQDIFRALQQFLFPRLSRACVFVFVFSPFLPREKKLKPRLQEAFEKELLQWLRFIVSNTAVTGVNRPQMMVVISHEDMYKSFGLDLRWRDTVLARFRSDFEDVIHIRPTSHLIDGHESPHVKPIVDEVFDIFNELFQRKLFKVPVACSDMSQHIVEWAMGHLEDPIIDDEIFFSLCEEIPDLWTFSQNRDEDDNKKLLKAVGSYLHDVGTVINMASKEDKVEKRGNPKSNLMVVNPNWLTSEFLGRFISFRFEFQLHPGETIEWKESVDGFLCETDFHQLLSKCFLDPMKTKHPKLRRDTLQDLMQNLDFLYVIEVVNQEGCSDSLLYFIPTLFKGRSNETLHWDSTGPAETVCFVGVRLRCKDSKRTYLSPAFFSRFQVILWRKLKEQQSYSSSVDCRFNLIRISMNGFDVLIENDGDGGEFIDVLIRSTKSRRTIWHYVENWVVQELRDFCASSKGCPGVELVLNIIRTKCVEHLTLCKHRKTQSVSREALKEKLMESIELSPTSEDKDLHLHLWERVPEAELEKEWEKAVELLPPEDVDEVYAWIKAKTQALAVKVIRLQDVIRGVDNDSKELSLRTRGVHISNLPEQLKEKKFMKSKSEQWPTSNIERVENLLRRQHQDLKADVRKVGERVEKVLIEIQDLKGEIQMMNHLRQREAETLTQMYSKLDQLMAYSVTEWPRRPYFTHNDVGMRHMITAAVNIGKPLMLHFDCEEKDGHHFVPNQPGYEIIVGRENSEALRQISKTSVRVIWYMVKAGLHISTNMGDLVPKLQATDGSISTLTSLSMVQLLKKVQVRDSRTSDQTADLCSPEKAWSYLQDFLERNLRHRITECFLLHRVQYFDSKSHAWLCQKCLEIGLEKRKLKKLG